MLHADRRRNYLRQRGGKRIHVAGSEGGFTSAQHRRMIHKLGHKKNLARKARRTRLSAGQEGVDKPPAVV